MTEVDIPALTIGVEATVRDALAAIDAGRSGLSLIVDDRRLVGLITDGDARRAILAGVGLGAPARSIATTSPTVVDPDTPRANVLDIIRARRLTAVPIVDRDGILVGLHTLSDMVGSRLLPNTAVIMAGGRGTRLGQLTDARPKPLLEVAGRPIIEWAILELVGSGIRTVHVSVGHLADQIVEHLGDGSLFGCSIDYLRDDPEIPLGTAGALALLAERCPDLAHPIIVMNGDIMARLDFAELLSVHERSGAAITIGTRPYEHNVPYGVIESAAGRVTAIEEKPTIELEVGAGVYAVDPAVLALVPRGAASTMPDLARDCIDQGRPVHTWPIHAKWIDVGTPQDLTRARSGE